MKKRVFFGILAVLAALCIIGCDDGKDNDKDKNKGGSEHSGKTLKVTDIPANVTIIAAALLNDTDMTDRAPSVSGFNVLDGQTGTFDLYEATADRAPDTSKPWNGSGGHFVVLAASMSPNDPQYYYTAGKEILEFNIDGFKAAVQADIAAYITAVTSNPPSQPTDGIATIMGQDGVNQSNVPTYITAKITGLGNDTVKRNMTKYDFTEKTSTLAWDQFRLLDQSQAQTQATAIISAQATQNQIQAALTELLTAMQTQLQQGQGG